MADKLVFDLVSPERALLTAEVDSVVIPGTEGNFAVLPGHAPVMSTIRPGVIDVEGTESGRQRFYIRGGFAEVTPAGLTVLAEETVPLDELDDQALATQIQNAREDVEDAKDDAKRQKAQEALDHLVDLQTALKNGF